MSHAYIPLVLALGNDGIQPAMSNSMKFERIRVGDQFIDKRFGDIVTVLDWTATNVTVETPRGIETELGVSPVELIWSNDFERYVLH